MKPIATITVNKYGCLMIEGKIKISKEARAWIKRHQKKGRHVAVMLAKLHPNGKTQGIAFVESSFNKLIRDPDRSFPLDILGLPKLRSALTEPPIDDFPEPD